ncbi:MAG: AAA family ATPase, partial [Deltaproteobacteria bacterium]|nr:AAA family ATPase [Deltaproteobacteria bacterium]
MKKLSYNVSDFKKIINSGFVYVDKTKLLKDLIESPSNQVFLARPRRFGKSLLLRTLHAIFEGDADLFAGLEIAKAGYKFEKYPVVYVNMALDSYSPTILHTGLMDILLDIGKSKGVEISSRTPSGVLRNIGQRLAEKHGQKVVILIDEYDYPISHNIEDTAVAKANSGILSGFYSSLKELEPYLHFVMVTGVTRYSMMGLSSGLNHLMDISFIEEYAAICGFTSEELKLYYGDRYDLTLDKLKKLGKMPSTSSKADLIKKILAYYDGYSWDGETRVLNPWSILYFFNRCKFDNFWFNTAPSLNFLSHVISTNCLALTPNNFIGVDPDTIVNPQLVNDVSSIPYLFYTGYLTIGTIIEPDDINNYDATKYNLKIPNLEVNTKFNTLLKSSLKKLINKKDDINFETFINLINNKDSIKLASYIRTIFSSLPSMHHQPNESRYHGILWGYFMGLLQDFDKVGIEVAKSGGNLDLLLLLKNTTHVVMELKYHPDDWIADKGEWKDYVNARLEATAKLALKTINNKKYSETFHCQGVEVVEVGVGIYGKGEIF